MAWIEEQRTKAGFVSYQVTWRENGIKKKRRLRDRAEAEALRDSLQHLRSTRWGHPQAPRMSLADKLRANAEFNDDGCWVWQRQIGKEGYGVVYVSRRTQRLAHRVSYETFLKPIPDGLQIDHLCRNRACIYPLHLEPVTARVNVLRSPIAQASLNAAKTHCPKGHPYDEANTGFYYRSGRRERRCKACARTRNRRASVRRRESRQSGRAA